MSDQYEIFRRFLVNEIWPTSPYQYQVLRWQLQNRGFTTTKEIAEEICSEYNHFPLEEYEKRRVDELPGKVLTERGVVRPARNGYKIVGEYDPTKMSDSELKELIDVCARGNKGGQVKANGMWTRGNLPRREPV